MNRDYEVVVCGGGVAGIAAALASARAGASTCLVEREYALGGLATLGLIVVYLPLCDGNGVQMSGGIAEELLKLSIQYGPGSIPRAWRDGSREPKDCMRYQVQYNAASFLIAAEELLLKNGVQLLYGVQLSDVNKSGDLMTSVVAETKRGRQCIRAKAFVDATGDADLCYFAGEKTVEDNTNRRTGWFFSYDERRLQLHSLTDSLYKEVPEDSRTYSGTEPEDVTCHCIDGRKMIMAQIDKMHQSGNRAAYPLLVPAIPGLRMTRRLSSELEFSERHQGVWFQDAIGMMGDWRKTGPRYSIPYRAIQGMRHRNLYAAGRCISADKSGWDIARVIPACAVSGQAAGQAAALQAISGQRPEYQLLQQNLKKAGALLDASLFERQENIK